MLLVRFGAGDHVGGEVVGDQLVALHHRGQDVLAEVAVVGVVHLAQRAQQGASVVVDRPHRLRVVVRPLREASHRGVEKRADDDEEHDAEGVPGLEVGRAFAQLLVDENFTPMIDRAAGS